MPAMDYDKFAMSEKIIRDIVNIFLKDSQLEEFDIIPVSTNHSNKSPVVHIAHSLGLESWCIKHVYSHAYTVLTENYFCRHEHRPKFKVTQVNCEEVSHLLMAALLISPDVSTFWNKRRDMCLRHLLALPQELRFSRLVLSRKSKSNEAFAYRKWLLHKYFADISSISFAELAALTQDELNLTFRCAEKSPNNYHAWSHRIWLIEQLAKYIPSMELDYLHIGELCFSERWITTHVSDYSGLHYRQFALNCVFKINDRSCFDAIDKSESFKYKNSLNTIMSRNLQNYDADLVHRSQTEKEIIESILGVILESEYDSKKYCILYQNVNLTLYELLLNEELSRLYISHEALWCHRRFTLKHLVDVIFQYFGEKKERYSCISSVGMNCTKSGTLDNITSRLEINDEILIEDQGDGFGKEPKILRSENHSVYNSSLYKALAVNEKKFIDQRSKSGDVFAIKYDRWLRHILGFPV